MDRQDFVNTFALMMHDAAAIIHHNQVIAGIKVQLDRNLLNPFEQDYIYREHFGQFPSEPKRQVINGVEITSRILHQTGIGLRDVQGADFLYEIENEKFIIIQYKRVSDSLVRADADQLETLISNCPEVCMHKKNRPIPRAWLPLKLNAFCGCWYSVMMAKIDALCMLGKLRRSFKAPVQFQSPNSPVVYQGTLFSNSSHHAVSAHPCDDQESKSFELSMYSKSWRPPTLFMKLHNLICGQDDSELRKPQKREGLCLCLHLSAWVHAIEQILGH